MAVCPRRGQSEWQCVQEKVRVSGSVSKRRSVWHSLHVMVGVALSSRECLSEWQCVQEKVGVAVWQCVKVKVDVVVCLKGSLCGSVFT